MFIKINKIKPSEIGSIHSQSAANLTFAQFGYHIIVVVVYLRLLDLKIFHEKFTHFIFKDTYVFVSGLVCDCWADILFLIFEHLFVFGVDGSEKGEYQIFPHFFCLKQKHYILLLIFQLFNIFIFHKGLQFFQDGLAIIGHDVVNIGLSKLILESLFVVTWIFLHFTFFLLPSNILVVLAMIGFLKNINFSVMRAISHNIHLVINTQESFACFSSSQPCVVGLFSFCYACGFEFIFVWGILLHVIAYFEDAFW